MVFWRSEPRPSISRHACSELWPTNVSSQSDLHELMIGDGLDWRSLSPRLSLLFFRTFNLHVRTTDAPLPPYFFSDPKAAGGATVLNWLIAITSASFFTNWIIISFTNMKFHQALKAQNDALFTQVYAWKSMWWPLAPSSLMVISILLFVCCIASGIKPSVSPRSGPSCVFVRVIQTTQNYLLLINNW